jgi:hypothetical protein
MTWWDLPPAALGGAAAVLVLGLSLLGYRWWTAEREPSGPRTRIPEYEPPDRLRPAEVGLLIDESADPRDLTATIVDLAVRGYLRIEEPPAQSTIGQRDWKIVRLREADASLAPYERRLLLGLFSAAPEGAVALSGIEGTFHNTLNYAEGDLYQASVENGWFRSEPSMRHRHVSGQGCLLVIVGALASATLGTAFGAGYGLVGVALGVVGVVAIVMARAISDRSEKGRELLWHIHGFRWYLETAETERLRFAEQQNIFAQYLPYAIVFGLANKWASVFAGLDAESAPQRWYVGSSGVSDVSVPAVTSGLSKFSSGLSTAIAAAPPASGLTGFGGSAGWGGRGAAGGGSW